MPSIVTVNVSQSVAPTPSTLQNCGAFVSRGGTTLAQGTFSLLTQASDLTPILATPLAITSLAWSGSVVTATIPSNANLPTGKTFYLEIAGAVPAGYNGKFPCTIVSATSFTYPLTANPGMETTPGTYTPYSTVELVNMTTDFFDQGSKQAVWVLELGIGAASDGITALGTYITANPNSNYTPGSTGYFYGYLVPESWSSEASFPTFLENYTGLTAKTYFFSEMTSGNYTSFPATLKDTIGLVPSPIAPVTEFSAAAAFWNFISAQPSSTNKVAPFAFRFLFGVTAYPTFGNSTLLTQLKAAGVNYVGSGAEGGISNTILLWGTTMDLKPINYWYSVDWAQLNIDLNISNAVINGSNNPSNPLYLDQEGINRLQGVGAATLSSAVSYGLALGGVLQTAYDQLTFNTMFEDGAFEGQNVINAVPFANYYKLNPSDYSIGKYGGFSAVYTPLRGFDSIIFNLNATSFAV